MTVTVSDLAERLHGVKWTHGGQRLMAICPAHPDSNPSLSVGVGDKQPVTVKCFAGCEASEVLSALDLTLADICEPSEAQTVRPRDVWYRYRRLDGQVAYWVQRSYMPSNGGWRKQFRPYQPDRKTLGLGGSEKVLYRLPELVEACQAGGSVVVAEGEKDVDALVKAGLVATCNPFGANSWEPRYAQDFDGAGEVIVIVDRDEAGHDWARAVVDSLTDAGVENVSTRYAKVGKDAADHLGAGCTFAEFVDFDLDGADQPAVQSDGDGWDDDFDFDVPYPYELASEEDLRVAYQAGPIAPPDVCTFELDGDTIGLFYRDATNLVFGATGIGKTWIAHVAVAQELAAGRPTLLLDPENTLQTVAQRLAQLGITEDQFASLLRWANVEGTLEKRVAVGLRDGLVADGGVLVVFDGWERMREHNFPELRDPNQAAVRMNVLLGRFAAGCCVVAFDHITMAAANSTKLQRDPAGAAQKRAQITGIAYSVTPAATLGRGRSGALKLARTKSRHGHDPNAVFELTLDDTVMPMHVSLKAGHADVTDPHSMDGGDRELIHVLAGAGELGYAQNDLLSKVGEGKTKLLNRLHKLQRLGYVWREDSDPDRPTKRRPFVLVARTGTAGNLEPTPWAELNTVDDRYQPVAPTSRPDDTTRQQPVMFGTEQS